MKSSSIFKKVLQDSGFDRRFDTIHEAEEEDESDEICETLKAENQQLPGKRPVSPKRFRKLSQDRKHSVPKEVWLHKTPRKQSEVRNANKVLNRTLSTLLQRTNSLAEQLNRGRLAIDNSLDKKTSLNGEISKSAGANLARIATGKDGDEKKRLRYSMPMLHREDALERKTRETYQHVMLEDEKTKIGELKPTAALRTSRFKTSKAPVNLDSSFPQPAFTKQANKKPLGHATSLPNLRLASLVDIPRNKTKRATGKTISPMQPINRYRSGLTTLRPPANAIAFDNLSLRSRYGDKDDVESLDSRSTKSWTATSSIKRDKSPRLVLKRQCYNTNSGKMVRMTNLFSSITNKSNTDSGKGAEDLWTQIRHCRYLRQDAGSPDRCSCNQCESHKKD